MERFQGLPVENRAGYLNKAVHAFAIQEQKYVGVLRVLYRSFVSFALSQQAWRLTRNRETKISSKAVIIFVTNVLLSHLNYFYLFWLFSFQLIT